MCILSCFIRVQLFATLWTVACQASLSMGFSRQGYWSGLPCLPPGDLPNPGIEPASLTSPALASGFFTTNTTWEAQRVTYMHINETFLYSVKIHSLSSLFSCSVVSWLFAIPWTAECQTSCPSPTPGAYSNSWPSSQQCYPTISSSVVPFSSCFQSFPASGSFLMNQFFASGGPSIGVSALASVLPVNIQGWFPLELTGLTSLQSSGLWRVFSSTTVWKHQFFSTQPSFWSNSHICPWLLEKP